MDIPELIAVHGRAVLGVFPTEDSRDPINDSFAYTIGNAAKGLPELLVVGMFNDAAMWLLNRVSEEMERGFREGPLDLGGARCVHVLPASEEAKAVHTIQATNYWRSERGYDLAQVVIPDLEGRFPWDADCAKPFNTIRVWRRVQA